MIRAVVKVGRNRSKQSGISGVSAVKGVVLIIRSEVVWLGCEK